MEQVAYVSGEIQKRHFSTDCLLTRRMIETECNVLNYFNNEGGYNNYGYMQ